MNYCGMKLPFIISWYYSNFMKTVHWGLGSPNYIPVFKSTSLKKSIVSQAVQLKVLLMIVGIPMRQWYTETQNLSSTHHKIRDIIQIADLKLNFMITGIIVIYWNNGLLRTRITQLDSCLQIDTSEQKSHLGSSTGQYIRSYFSW